MNASELVGRLDGVQGRGPYWRAICPSHQSKHRTRSLAVREADDGRILVHCFAGCGIEEITGALGIDLVDLYPPRLDADASRMRKPWRTSDVARALRGELMVYGILFSDLLNGKRLTKSDRERGEIALDRVGHLMLELENAA